MLTNATRTARNAEPWSVEESPGSNRSFMGAPFYLNMAYSKAGFSSWRELKPCPEQS